MSAIADSLVDCLTSENESDDNLEAANVVDGLFAIARALDRVADVMDKQGTELMRQINSVTHAAYDGPIR